MKHSFFSVIFLYFAFTYVLLVDLFSLEEKRLPNDLRWVRQSLEYKSLCEQIYRQASKKISLINEISKEHLAVVVDLDETVLDNSEYQVERLKLGLNFSQDSWSNWVNRKSSTLVPGAKKFLNRVRELGIKVVFLSNRMHANLKPTKENLRSLGVFSENDLFLLRRNNSDTKKIRRAEILSGTGRISEIGPMKVVAYLGDQMGDFPAHYPKDLGTSVFIFPNPMYGKW